MQARERPQYESPLVTYCPRSWGTLRGVVSSSYYFISAKPSKNETSGSTVALVYGRVATENVILQCIIYAHWTTYCHLVGKIRNTSEITMFRVDFAYSDVSTFEAMSRAIGVAWEHDLKRVKGFKVGLKRWKSADEECYPFRPFPSPGHSVSPDKSLPIFERGWTSGLQAHRSWDDFRVFRLENIVPGKLLTGMSSWYLE